jgi:enamine deaminase RidA (YjgF/YER057c/UK114 family)
MVASAERATGKASLAHPSPERMAGCPPLPFLAAPVAVTMTDLRCSSCPLCSHLTPAASAILCILSRSSKMADTPSSDHLQQFSSDVSRRRLITAAATLAVAGTISPAAAQLTDRSPNMPDNIRFSNPDTMQKPPGQPPGYSHVVEVTGPGRTVYFAGQLGIDKSGKMGADAREQMEIAFENVKAALASVGASFEQVVKLNNYIVDIGTNIAHYREVRDKYVNKAAPPASTTIGVPQLARPGALFEVEAIAVLPPK